MCQIMLMVIAECRALYVPDIERRVKADVRDALTMDIIQNHVKYIVVVKRKKRFSVVCARIFPAKG